METFDENDHNEVPAGAKKSPRREPAPQPNADPIEVREVLCADQVAAWLGVNRKTIYNAAARGHLPCQRLGKRMLFSRRAIGAWLRGAGPAVAPEASQ